LDLKFLSALAARMEELQIHHTSVEESYRVAKKVKARSKYLEPVGQISINGGKAAAS